MKIRLSDHAQRSCRKRNYEVTELKKYLNEIPCDETRGKRWCNLPNTKLSVFLRDTFTPTEGIIRDIINISFPLGRSHSRYKSGRG